MKIITWNVNGVRAIYKKGFSDWLKKENADIVCLQETKADPKILSDEFKKPLDYFSYWNNGSKSGYSGVVTYSKVQPLEITNKFPKTPEFHEEGRVVETKYSDFTLLNIYFPNGGTRADGTEMLSYKLRFYDLFIDYVQKKHKKGESVIICGDFNIAHTEIDIARPKENEHSIGFLPEERIKLDKLIKTGFVDIFRWKNPKLKDQYTWWSYRTRARERNVGWRLDYFFVSPDLKKRIKKIEILTDVMGSDHCPVLLEIN